MFSNRPDSTIRRQWRRVLAWLAGWSLRRQLIVGILALFAIAFAVIGTVSTVAMRTVLVHQIDAQLTQTDRRAGGGPPPGGPPDGRRTPNFVGQPPGTVNASISGGVVSTATVLDPDLYPPQRPLTGAQSAMLTSVPTDGHPHTISLDDLGSYRVVATKFSDGDVLITGLPLGDVQNAVWLLLAIEGGVAVVGL